MRMGRLMVANALATGLVLLGAAAQVWADDVDGDGVDDSMDVCNNTPPGTAVDAEGRPLGDIDEDCDTDLDDHGLFQQGFTGPLDPPVGACCYPQSACVVETEAECAGSWQGVGTTCDPNPCSGVVIDTVPVGNPGNADDWHGTGYGYGGVDYVFNIGTFEVTAGQYTEFLNAVADDDTYGLYNTSMLSSSRGCKIRRTGSSGSYVYLLDADEDDVEDADWVDRPVNFVSWGDAARFANWLHNGQPTGVQDLSTTEDGSYFLDGAMSDAELLAIMREPDATWVIPSEDEWYKAAYHKNDGVTGNYFNYPTSSDSAPSMDLVEPIDPGNNATYWDYGYTIDSPYYRTEGGAHENSESPYDTFDQGGNVWEWNEAIVSGSLRGPRGGSFSGIRGYLHAGFRMNEYTTSEYDRLGFRVAEVP